MKTYQDYYYEWQISTESRDLAFDEWLMLQLERQKQQIINKAWKWVEDACSKHSIAADELSILKQSFKHTMEE